MAEIKKIHWHGQDIVFHRLGGLFLPQEKILCLADLHLGRRDFFLEQGIPLPDYGEEQDWAKVETLIAFFSPARIVFLGDLFHYPETLSAGFVSFLESRIGQLQKRFTLIQGNHDKKIPFQIPGLELAFRETVCGGLTLLHDRTHALAGDIVVCGHEHPAVFLPLAFGRTKVSCFWVREKQIILPAMSSLAAGSAIRPKFPESAFVLLPDEIAELNLGSGESSCRP